jgi:glycosyltransferase involved in cell wall biosynthesis
MSQPLGVVSGPTPTGGPNPNPNKPGGALPAQGQPGVPGPGPQAPGVVPTPVQVQPHIQHIAPNAAPKSTAPAGVVNHIAVQPVAQAQNPVILQPPAAHHQMPPQQVARGVAHGMVPGPGFYIHGSPGGTPRADQQGYIAPHLHGAWEDRKKIWRELGVVVSSVLSIHNRSKLFKRALQGYLWQTMPAENWEIVLVDDCSTEDLSETYKHLIGRINLRHVRFDHTRHPLFKAKNPGWTPGQKKNWYHTPALTINLGMHVARGPIISLCHPEILHAPENFELAAIRILKEEAVYLFGTTFLGTQESNKWLDRNPSWVNFGWKGFLGRVAGHTLEKYTVDKYWYTSFLPRIAGRTVGGVDFEYLNGVAGEDDDFRDRVDLAGYAGTWAPELEGMHQNHDDESEAHRVRTTDEWKRGLAHNRALYAQRKATKRYPSPANAGADWTAKECFVEERRFSVGSKEPQIITKVS